MVTVPGRGEQPKMYPISVYAKTKIPRFTVPNNTSIGLPILCPKFQNTIDKWVYPPGNSHIPYQPGTFEPRSLRQGGGLPWSLSISLSSWWCLSLVLVGGSWFSSHLISPQLISSHLISSHFLSCHLLWLDMILGWL